MAILDYQSFFVEHQQGNAAYQHIFSNPVASHKDAAISDDDKEKLKDALSKSARQQSITLTFYGPRSTHKTLQLNQLAYQSGRPVCLIDCAELTSKKYIGETEKNLAKLIAGAENKNWILFFDEADALFSQAKQDTSLDMQDGPSNFNNRFKYIAQYKGISIFNIQQKSHLNKLTLKTDYMIHFDT